jgi:acetylornithine deacetylase
MSSPVPSVVERLGKMVRFDTQNPTGDERPLAQHLAAELKSLGAREVTILDPGQRHVSVHARFGARPARLLLNAHIDTVPANAGYTRPPLEPVVEQGRLYGLGAADTKGAIAAILEAFARAPATDGIAVLFSGDEEHGNESMRRFLASDRARGLERAVACEPTRCRLGMRHRGIGVATATAFSPGGHSSRADQLPAPIVILARAAVSLDALGKRYRKDGQPGFEGVCMNVASLDGGIAFNVVPSKATLAMSMRPPPGVDVAALMAEAGSEIRRAAAPDAIEWTVAKVNPAFETRDRSGFAALFGGDLGDPVDLDFWTEAALLSAAGIDAVVFGPGDIAQAHGPDEFVEIAELETAVEIFGRLMR